MKEYTCVTTEFILHTNSFKSVFNITYSQQTSLEHMRTNVNIIVCMYMHNILKIKERNEVNHIVPH
jgi:hypothetical protein